MKPGTVLPIPPLAESRPPAAGGGEPISASARGGEPMTASARVAAPIDPNKQYRVQSGDNLYRISVKLYGKSTMAGKIYELNKQAIGSDPAKLKADQVLELPEPPTV